MWSPADKVEDWKNTTLYWTSERWVPVNEPEVEPSTLYDDEGEVPRPIFGIVPKTLMPVPFRKGVSKMLVENNC